MGLLPSVGANDRNFVSNSKPDEGAALDRIPNPRVLQR